MKLLRNKFLRDSSLYTLANIVEKAIPFLLLPVLTRYLTASDYGVVAMFGITINLVTPFISLGTRPAILRSYYKEEIDFSKYVSSVLMIVVFSTIFSYFLFTIFSSYIASTSQLPPPWLKVVIIVSYGQFIMNILLVIWQAKMDPIKFGLFKILYSLINMGGSVLLILIFDFDWRGRVLGQTIAASIFGLVAIYLLYQYGFVKFRISKAYIKHALKFGLPLVPHIMSGMVIVISDKLFITHMVGIEVTGIYAVGYQIGMIVEVVAKAFQIAWTPWLYKQLNIGTDLAKQKAVKVSYIAIGLLIGVTFVISVLAPIVMPFLIGKGFENSSQYVVWIATGYAFKGVYYMLAVYITYVERTQLITLITFAVAIINLILNYFFINVWGALGAAYATTISYFIQFIFIVIAASRVYKMPWSKVLISIFRKE